MTHTTTTSLFLKLMKTILISLFVFCIAINSATSFVSINAQAAFQPGLQSERTEIALFTNTDDTYQLYKLVFKTIITDQGEQKISMEQNPYKICLLNFDNNINCIDKVKIIKTDKGVKPQLIDNNLQCIEIYNEFQKSITGFKNCDVTTTTLTVATIFRGDSEAQQVYYLTNKADKNFVDYKQVYINNWLNNNNSNSVADKVVTNTTSEPTAIWQISNYFNNSVKDNINNAKYGFSLIGGFVTNPQQTVRENPIARFVSLIAVICAMFISVLLLNMGRKIS